MVCCRSFIVQKIYDLLRDVCGFLDFLPLDMFSDRPDVKPAWALYEGPSFKLPKVELIWGIELDVFIFICATLYKFEKCNKSTDGHTTDPFIAIPAVTSFMVERRTDVLPSAAPNFDTLVPSTLYPLPSNLYYIPSTIYPPPFSSPYHAIRPKKPPPL